LRFLHHSLLHLRSPLKSQAPWLFALRVSKLPGSRSPELWRKSSDSKTQPHHLLACSPFEILFHHFQMLIHHFLHNFSTLRTSPAFVPVGATTFSFPNILAAIDPLVPKAGGKGPLSKLWIEFQPPLPKSKPGGEEPLSKPWIGFQPLLPSIPIPAPRKCSTGVRTPRISSYLTSLGTKVGTLSGAQTPGK
jgi:hypothetical protein